MSSNNSFESLDLGSSLKQNLVSLGYQQATEIQQKALPPILAGQDVIAQAQTGSGKTAAFGLGLLQTTSVCDFYTQSLVLCPTRELASQVAEEIRRLGRRLPNLKVLTLCGGTPMGPQIASLEHGAHVIVGTPGRVCDHLRRRRLNLRGIKSLVLDEADRMLAMGFAEDLDYIVSLTPRWRQTMLFSATFPDEIQQMSDAIQNNPTLIKVAASTHNTAIEQRFIAAKKGAFYDRLQEITRKLNPNTAIVFCTTKRQCDEVATFLQTQGRSALAIHSDLEQQEREEALIRFANGSITYLVATDVAARGLDIANVALVINFELSRDPEVHIHRIGRTGRAGAKGLAVSLYNPSEEFRIKAIESLMGCTLPRQSPLPSLAATPPQERMTTLKIYGGKKEKLRPGDILGALTKDAGIPAAQIGKINILDFDSYVAITSAYAQQALTKLRNTRIKNRRFGMNLLP